MHIICNSLLSTQDIGAVAMVHNGDPRSGVHVHPQPVGWPQEDSLGESIAHDGRLEPIKTVLLNHFIIIKSIMLILIIIKITIIIVVIITIILEYQLATLDEGMVSSCRIKNHHGISISNQ